MEIIFAYGSFNWIAKGKGQAHVHVVIIGLARRGVSSLPKRLYSDDGTYTECESISPYLREEASEKEAVVVRATRPLNRFPRMVMGTKPIDDGNYILTEDERQGLLQAEPLVEDLMRPFMGAREFLSGTRRWILCLADASPSLLQGLPKVRERIKKVREFRMSLKECCYPQAGHVA